jgi:hypothetical protein
MNGTVPRVFHTGMLAGRAVSMESGIAGTSMKDAILSRKRRADETRFRGTPLECFLTDTIGWLTDFQMNCRCGETVLDDATLRTYLDPVLAAVDRAVQDSTEQAELRDKLMLLGNTVRGKRIPLAAQHRDLCPSNILLRNGSLAVVDWELAREAGEPTFDLYHFLSRFFFWALSSREKYPICDPASLAAFTERTFFRGAGETHELLSSLMQEYCSRLRIDPAVARLLFLWQEVDRNRNDAVIPLYCKRHDRFIVQDTSHAQHA